MLLSVFISLLLFLRLTSSSAISCDSEQNVTMDNCMAKIASCAQQQIGMKWSPDDYASLEGSGNGDCLCLNDCGYTKAHFCLRDPRCTWQNNQCILNTSAPTSSPANTSGRRLSSEPCPVTGNVTTPSGFGTQCNYNPLNDQYPDTKDWCPFYPYPPDVLSTDCQSLGSTCTCVQGYCVEPINCAAVSSVCCPAENTECVNKWGSPTQSCQANQLCLQTCCSEAKAWVCHTLC